jgi:hypothetical protein
VSENPDWPVKDWQHDVANSDTRLGYEEWVDHNIESARDQLVMALASAIHGIDEQDVLDGLVHDAKSSEASTINNQGHEEQIRYLLERGFTESEIRAAIFDEATK